MATLSGATRVASYSLLVYRRLWRLNLLSSFVQPMLYLLGLGVGVGALVDENPGSTDILGGVSYVSFVAPGLLVTAAMAMSAQESMWPVMGAMKWQRTYHAMAATPLRAGDIVGGHALWMLARSVIGGGAVALALALFPETRTWGLVPAAAVAAITGLAFAMPLMAYAVAGNNDGRFAAIQRFLIIPLFLFGGAFYPITQLPQLVQWIVQVFPLWHGVEVARMAYLGDVEWPSAGWHLVYIMVWVVVGAVAAERRLTTELYP
jgi:lipooligosaccharide transport system permease protein